MTTRQLTDEIYEGRMFAGGRDLNVSDSAPVFNPARLDEQVGTMPKGTVGDTAEVIQRAHEAFPAWAELSMDERARKIAGAIEAVTPGIDGRARLLTRENGKVLQEARADVQGVKRCTDFYLDAVKDFEMEWELPSPNGTVKVLRQSMGVASIIVPWNGPVVLAYLGVAPALAAGNTVVVKPSSFVPLALIDTVRLMAAQLPPGVLNLVTGTGATVGKELVTHPLVRRVIFTGSTETGKQVVADAASTLKRCTMELGGNDPALVLEDADLDTAVPGIINGVFAGTGQICYDIKRIYVHRNLYDRFVNRFTEAAAEIVVGDGLDADVTMGPLTTKPQFDFVNQLIADTKAGPANVVEAGRRAVSDDEWRNGYFIRPHVVTEIDQSAAVVSCEQFGPVIPIMPFDDEEEAIRLANDTEFGLASSVWSEDSDRAWRLARKIEAGTTFVNAHVFASGVDMPFGGFKSSGLGRGHGIVALEEQFELHTVSSRKP